MILKDKFPRLKGHFRAEVKRKGRLIYVVENENKILNTARESMAYLTVGEEVEDRKVQYFWLGTGGHAPGDVLTPIEPSASDTWLDEPIAVGANANPVEVDTWTRPASNTLRMHMTIGEDDFNGNVLTEALLSGDYTPGGSYPESDYPWSRDTFKGIPKESDLTVDFYWEYQF